jgi:Domain of unknown function (DUF2341)/Concanavalin A-like lectin/glucanases superfamily/Carbohydrate esterase, sialic acid-specific acetylesterase/Glucose-regulated metallo-peptidase M90
MTWLVVVQLGTCLAIAVQEQGPAATPSRNSNYKTIEIEGWSVKVSEQLLQQEKEATDRALELLTKQLQEINQVVPAAAVAELHKVPLWISPEYPNVQPRAEYHPGAGWLRENNRDPAMEKAVEFTNVRIFEQETARMPNFALHELAHAYHDRVLPDGFGNKAIKAAYKQAKADGLYDDVEQRFGDGRSANVRAYAMTNPQEYFAECSEAFFSTNDFYPFTRDQLAKYDPRMCEVLKEVWGQTDADAKSAESKPGNREKAYADWAHSGSLFILTTPEGAGLPESATLENFPLLVRLNKQTFDFAQAKPTGDDIRFSTAEGQPLAYQIEEWNSANGTAAIWVRIPKITGNARQEIKVHWGNAKAASESSGAAVFNESNGYVVAMHMGDSQGVGKDEVGTVLPVDAKSESAEGLIGFARRFGDGRGIVCGDKLDRLPKGSQAHSTQAWIKAEKTGGTVIGWGKEQGRGKVVLIFDSPPHIRLDCYFSGANVASEGRLPLSEWVHVVHTCAPGDSRVYVNGRLDGVSARNDSPLDLPSPAGMWIGGWYGHYSLQGDLDEVRLSNVSRSADWIRLEYENQKLLQTAVGHIVQPGEEFSVSDKSLQIAEGQSASVSARADGAQKVYWAIKRGNQETIVAVDQFSFDFHAGRVTGDTSATLQFKAIFAKPPGSDAKSRSLRSDLGSDPLPSAADPLPSAASEVRTLDIPITIRESIPEPVVTLAAPIKWDGRSTIEVVPQIANLKQMQAAGADKLKFNWTVSGLAAIREVRPDRLLLTRAQNSGELTVTLKLDNGGAETTAATSISVREPDTDPWIARTPEPDEKPVDNQFYSRDDRNEGTLFCNGTLAAAADSVVLKIFADDKPYKTEAQSPGADQRYAFAVKLKPGLIKYRLELVSVSAKKETVLHTAANIVCGDAYLIDGQSNALATDWGPDKYETSSEWIRSFGSNNGDISRSWGNAVRREGGHFEIGCWGMDLAQSLVERHKIPICIINGAVGGTLIEAHQRSAENPIDPATIYGRMLNRVQHARLTHGIRGVFWHQGENNQGAQGATGKYGWETYEKYFVEMAGAWQQDFPNIQHFYVFQIWPNACAMGGQPASDRLRDVQRRLPHLYSNMTAIATLGIKPEGGCHFPPAGYAELAQQVLPVVEQFNYGVVPAQPVTSPNLQRVSFTSDRRDEIALEFDQPMSWDNALITQFYLGGAAGLVSSGSVSGKTITLKLTAPSTSKTISYLIDKRWDSKNLLYGQNQRAALTFFEMPLK